MEEKMITIPAGYVCVTEYSYTNTIKDSVRFQTKAEEMEKELRSLKADMATMRQEYGFFKEFFSDSSNSYHKKCYDEFIAERHQVEIPKEF